MEEKICKKIDKEILKTPDKNIEVPVCLLTGDKDKYCCLEIKGNNYLPYFHNGDYVICDLDLTKENPTDIYLVEIENKLELRRIKHPANDGNENFVSLEGLTSYIPPEFLEIGSFKVWGKIYLLMRKFSEV